MPSRFHETPEDGKQMRRRTIEVISYRRVILVGERISHPVGNPLAHSVSEHLAADTEQPNYGAPLVVTNQSQLKVRRRKLPGTWLINLLFGTIEKSRNRSTLE